MIFWPSLSAILSLRKMPSSSRLFPLMLMSTFAGCSSSWYSKSSIPVGSISSGWYPHPLWASKSTALEYPLLKELLLWWYSRKGCLKRGTISSGSLLHSIGLKSDSQSSIRRKGSCKSSLAESLRDTEAKHFSTNSRTSGSFTLYKASGFFP